MEWEQIRQHESIKDMPLPELVELNTLTQLALNKLDQDEPLELEVKETYNGYTNWETWELNNWVNVSDLISDLTDELEQFADKDKQVEKVAKIIKDTIIELSPLDNIETGFHRSMLTNALDEVDYQQLAELAIEDNSIGLYEEEDLDYYEWTISAYFLPAIVNGDLSGLDGNDIESFEWFQKELEDLRVKENATHYTIDYDSTDETYYGKCEICNLMSDCIDIKVHYFPKN